jgi:hypothetical protein
MAFTVNITVVWYVMVCSLGRNLLMFRRNYCLYLLDGRISMLFCPEVGGNKFLY